MITLDEHNRLLVEAQLEGLKRAEDVICQLRDEVIRLREEAEQSLGEGFQEAYEMLKEIKDISDSYRNRLQTVKNKLVEFDNDNSHFLPIGQIKEIIALCNVAGIK